MTTILRYTVVDDFGAVINPMLLEGQVHGGVVQGIGQALLEETVYDEDSASSSPARSWTTPCRAPTTCRSSRSRPATCRCKANPLGIKGAGEAGAIGAPPALINAIVDALHHKGIRHIDMPATPKRVWEALHAAGPQERAHSASPAAGEGREVGKTERIAICPLPPLPQRGGTRPRARSAVQRSHQRLHRALARLQRPRTPLQNGRSAQRCSMA